MRTLVAPQFDSMPHETIGQPTDAWRLHPEDIVAGRRAWTTCRLEAVQLTPGPSTITALQATWRRRPVARVTLLCAASRTLLRIATVPSDRTFVVVAPGARAVHESIHPLPANAALLVAGGPRFELLVEPGMAVLVLQPAVAAKSRIDDTRAHLLQLREDDLASLRDGLHFLKARAGLASERSAHPWEPAALTRWVQRTQEWLATVGDVAQTCRTIRQEAVLRAREHIDRHAARNMTLHDLCSAAGVGTRTLEYGFRETYGLGPMAFLRCVRLHAVRRDLVRPSVRGSVTSIAKRWGFSHMGQFGRDYRKMYGEPPSVTSRQARRLLEGRPARAPHEPPRVV